MPKHTQRYFMDQGDRYYFDFGMCQSKNGWFQIDTHQDASYFGVWTHPGERRILTYAEGDVTIETFDADGEYVEGLRACLDFYDTASFRARIDGSFGGDAIFERLGAKDLCYPRPPIVAA